MGLNTVAVLLNDMCGEMEACVDLGKRMSYVVQNWNHVDGKGYFGVGRVISRGHSDDHQVVVVHGNTGCTVREATNVSYLALDEMADCLKRHGWTAKPPKRKAEKL